MQEQEIKKIELDLLKTLKTTIFKYGVTLQEIKSLITESIDTRERWMKRDIATPVREVSEWDKHTHRIPHGEVVRRD